MSLETSLTSIAKSLEIIATYLSTTKNVQTTTIETTHAATPIPSAPVPAVTVSAPSSAPILDTPVAPILDTPVAAAPVSPSAFTDKQAMMDFVIASYKSLGTERGAKIQDVLSGMGYQNINDVPPAQWGQLKTGIEGLAK